MDQEPASGAGPVGSATTETGARDLAAARGVLELEADGLRALAEAIDDDFVKAVDLIAGVTGRVIFSGMGKSGHIGRKIASTLASTGTPAHFVHPGEASHGDLGMILHGDAAVLLSNSGGTEELRDLVAYTRFRSIPLLAIVGKAGSPLAAAADVALTLPEVPEACPMGLAPTTSTTMMLALGDALAVALMGRRGFSSEQFRVLHPGGRLGRAFLKVEDLMHSGEAMPLTTPETPLSQAILTLTACRFGCVGVKDEDGRLIGIITDGDLARHMDADLMRRRAGEVMTAGPKTIGAKALAANALGQMNDSQITCLFVVDDDGIPVGIVHVHDILREGIA